MAEYVALVNLSHRGPGSQRPRRIEQGEIFSDVAPEMADELIARGLIAPAEADETDTRAAMPDEADRLIAEAIESKPKRSRGGKK